MAQSYSSFICFLAWTSNIFARPPSKRAVALAFINAFSQLGNVASSWVSCVVCWTFIAFGINFIRTGICGKSPGVRPMPIRTRFAFRRRCSALPCASSSGRCSPKRIKICRSASPREAEGTDIYFEKYQYNEKYHHMNRRFSTQAATWPQLRCSVDATQHNLPYEAEEDPARSGENIKAVEEKLILRSQQRFGPLKPHPLRSLSPIRSPSFSLSSARNVIPLHHSPSLFLLFPPRCIHPPSTCS
jgi:hypothetical protein